PVRAAARRSAARTRASACSTSSVRVRSTIPGTRHGADQNVNERVQRWLSRTRHLEKPVVPDIRGKVTIADVVDVAPEEYAAAVHRWAGSVWGPGASITPSRAPGSPRPGRAERLAFGERHGWITPLAALPFVPAFAILVCVPLALRAVGPGDSTGRLLIATYPIAAAAAILAIVVPSGIPSAAIAVIWLAFTALAALHGLPRVFGSTGRIEELCT